MSERHQKTLDILKKCVAEDFQQMQVIFMAFCGADLY